MNEWNSGLDTYSRQLYRSINGIDIEYIAKEFPICTIILSEKYFFIDPSNINSIIVKLVWQ